MPTDKCQVYVHTFPSGMGETITGTVATLTSGDSIRSYAVIYEYQDVNICKHKPMNHFVYMHAWFDYE